MREYRFTDLDAAQLIFIHCTHHVASINFDAVYEFNRIISAVDLFYYEADFVLFQPGGVVIKIIANFDDAALFLRCAAGHLYLERKCCCGVAL